MDNIETKLKIRCESILLKLRNYFPTLEGVPIIIQIKELKIGSMWAKKRIGKFIVIIDPKKYYLANDSQIRGALVHELVHFANYNTLFGWFKCGWENVVFYSSRRLMRYYEQKTDKRVIDLGFAKDLYSNRQFRIKTSSKAYFKDIGKCYLSPKEIKSYARSIGKWQ